MALVREVKRLADEAERRVLRGRFVEAASSLTALESVREAAVEQCVVRWPLAMQGAEDENDGTLVELPLAPGYL
ncbi:MAG: hypothetical protein ACKOBG_04910 [Actinomycetota bacterium]